MEKKHGSGLKGNPGSTVIATNGTNFGDIFICGTARACAVKNCFKRNTHYHCSLCPDRRLVKEQNMVAHQIFHVNGRLEKRSIRDNHFTAYSGACGRASCRFDMANKKHHHCKLCDWPCCGRKLQRCSGHIKTKHPEIFKDDSNNDPISQVLASPHKTSSALPLDEADCKQASSNGHLTKTSHDTEFHDYNHKDKSQPVTDIKVEMDENSYGEQFSDEVVRVERSDEQENIKLKFAWSASNKNGNHAAACKTEDMVSADSDKMAVDDCGTEKDDLAKNQDVYSLAVMTPTCEFPGCRDVRTHFHCNLCEFVANKKNLLERHQNIHARGFHEKRKQRELYFTGSTGPCDIQGCRFGPLKQRHFHCKLCGWPCSSRKLQRCIKHITDKHRIDLHTDITEETNPASPQFSPAPTVSTSPPSVEGTPQGSNSAKTDQKTIPLEDDLFFVSKSDVSCEVSKCPFEGLHYHCRRCPFVTKQKHSRVRHRTIHLKGYPERRMLRDQHFSVYDGVCGRTCRFSVPRRKHFHCKYCDWPCCARKMPRCLNHLKRKHCEVLDEEDETMQTPDEELSKKTRMENPEKDGVQDNENQAKMNEKDSEPSAEQQNRVIILEEENNDCPFVIKDVHSLRDSSEDRTAVALNGGREAEANSHRVNEDGNRMEVRQPIVRSYEKSFKQYKRPANVNGPMFVNGHGYPLHHPERPIMCRVCRAFANERLPLRKMVVYSTSNRVELDLRLTSLLCTYFRVSIEDAFNSYICERDFEDWCNFHAQKISVYPVIAVENEYETLPNPHDGIPMDEHYSQY